MIALLLKGEAMGRGGQREGAGRKSGWKHSETQTIRVPKIFAVQVLDYARQLDAGAGIFIPDHEIPDADLGISDQFDSETISELPPEQEVVPGQTSIFDFIDSVPESKLMPLRGDQLAERFGINRGRPSSQMGRYRDKSEKFLRWTKDHDPDGVGWEFNPTTKRFHPLPALSEESVQVQ
jgi:hypothetical protein